MDRIIHTGLKSKTAKDICSAIIGQMSDGFWENSPGIVKYWLFAKADQLDDGEVVFNIDNRLYAPWSNKYVNNAFFRMCDSEILEFFQKKIKFILSKELRESHMTLRKAPDDMRTIWLSYQDDVTVKDVKDVIRLLKASSVSAGIAEASDD